MRRWRVESAVKGPSLYGHAIASWDLRGRAWTEAGAERKMRRMMAAEEPGATTLWRFGK